MKFLFKFKNRKGFIIPFAVIITTITLSISLGISMILIKEVFFSRLSRDSALAYYAADTALECALSVDNSYVDPSTGLGVFPYDIAVPAHTIDAVFANISSNRGIAFASSTIYCATAPIFSMSTSSFSFASWDGGAVGIGATSSSTLHMKLDSSGKERCAIITVNKTTTYRQIISRGYSNCSIGGPNTLERAVVNTTQF